MWSATFTLTCWSSLSAAKLYKGHDGSTPDAAVFPNVRSLPGAAVVISLVLYPYVYLLARGSFVQQSSVLHETARTLGATGSRLFTRVALPVAWPAIAGGLALVLMETVADFGVVEHYGVPTFTSGIFRTWFAMGEPAAALQLGVGFSSLFACWCWASTLPVAASTLTPLVGKLLPSLRLHGHCRAGLSAWSVSCPLFSVCWCLCWPLLS